MDIYTMTWYRGENYGSVLQAYALPCFLKTKGYECRTLAYRPGKLQSLFYKFITGNISETLGYKANEAATALTREKRGKKRKRAFLFDKFRKEHMDLTDECRSGREIEKRYGGDSIFICGSDQIWNPYLYDPNMYLRFEKDRKKKIAYAASFGVKEIPANMEQRILNDILTLDNISVREKSGAEIVRRMTGINIPVTADPVLLLTKEKWEELMAPSAEQEPYLFCYMLGGCAENLHNIKVFAAEKSLKVCIVPVAAEDYDDTDAVQYPTGPCEWLRLIKNADYVVTDSFHCLLFSVMFHRQFTVFRRFSGEDSHSQNTRILWFLKQTGFESRDAKMSGNIKRSIITKDQFSAADNAIRKRQTYSRRWLLKTVQKAIEACGTGQEKDS